MKIAYRNLFLTVMILCIASCRSGNKDQALDPPITLEEPVIEIVTETMDFQTVDTIASGWNTFRYINKSHEAHFFLLDKYPDGKTIEDGEIDVAPTFQKGMDLINDGKPELGIEAFNDLPAWFFEVVFSGGSGLVSPGSTSETTLKMEPGYYVIECYVKMPNGMFHSAMGMVKELIVTEENSGKQPPSADVAITISSEHGITFNDTIKTGNQTFSVFFQDQIVHENFVGHDVNLIQINEGGDLQELEKWMNWADPKGLISPSPAGITFLGGVNDMPAGSTGYFKVSLEPGNYAFISEVPNTSDKNMLVTFKVSE